MYKKRCNPVEVPIWQHRLDYSRLMVSSAADPEMSTSMGDSIELDSDGSSGISDADKEGKLLGL